MAHPIPTSGCLALLVVLAATATAQNVVNTNPTDPNDGYGETTRISAAVDVSHDTLKVNGNTVEVPVGADAWAAITAAIAEAPSNGARYSDHVGYISDLYVFNATEKSQGVLQSIFSNIRTAGTIEIHGSPGIKEVVLPLLASVAEDLEFYENNNIQSFSAPVLTTVGDDLYMYDEAALLTFRAPMLRHVGDNVYLGSYAWEQGGQTPSTCALESFDLSSLAIVGGYVELEGMGPIKVASFPALSFVGGYLDVDFNKHLTRLFTPMLQIVGEIEVNSNAVLPVLSFPALVFVLEDVAEHDNAKLTHISSPELLAIGGKLEVMDDHTAVHLPKACTITEREQNRLPTLATTNICDTQEVKGGQRTTVTLRDDVLIVNNEHNNGTVVMDIEELGVLTAVTGRLYITNSSQRLITRLVKDLVLVGGVKVYKNDKLLDLEFPALVTIGPPGNGVRTQGDLDMSRNMHLKTMSFPKLKIVPADYYVYDLPALETLHAPELVYVGEDVYIGKENLASEDQSLAAFDLSSLAIVGGYVELVGMGPIESFALPQLKYIGDGFNINENTHLQHFTVPQLVAIDDDVDIDSNAALVAASFPQLVFVGQDVSAQQNPVLKAIAAPILAQLRSGRLELHNNIRLTDGAFPVLCHIGTNFIYVAVNAPGYQGAVCPAPPPTCAERQLAAQRDTMASLQGALQGALGPMHALAAQLKALGLDTHSLETNAAALGAALAAPHCL